MDELIAGGGAGVAGSIIGGLVAFFGVKSRIEKLEATVITKTECESCKEVQKQKNQSQDERLSDMKIVLNEVRNDVKFLVRQSPKRKDD